MSKVDTKPAYVASERIGILLVHGMGEQTSGGHLEETVKELATALERQKNPAYVKGATLTKVSIDWCKPEPESLTPTPARGAKIHVDSGAPGAPVLIDVREAYWADLDEDPGPINWLKFWCWAFSTWAIRPDSRQPAEGMILPPQQHRMLRPIIFAATVLVLLALLTISPFVYLARRLGAGRVPLLSPIVSYLGDVRLMAEAKRYEKEELDAIGLPPRFSIRRRMVTEMVHMAMAGYDRWYIMAHSLGTVVALNGLMEPEHGLPTYLGEETWRTVPSAWKAVGAVDPKSPPSPPWLTPKTTLRRSELFRNLQGALLYGQPFDKFAAFWPRIIALNRDASVFHPDFRLYAVRDPLDVIAGSAAACAEGFLDGQVVNVAYPSNRVLLIGHTTYMKARRVGRGLSDAAAEWILTGIWTPPQKTTPTAYGRVGLQALLFVVFLLIIQFLGVELIGWLAPDSGSTPSEKAEYLPAGLYVLAISLAVAVLAPISLGIGRRLLKW